MASQHILDARRVKAVQETAEQIKEVNLKLDLIIAHLGIQYPPVAAEPAPEQTEGEPKVEGEPENSVVEPEKSKRLKSAGSK